MKQMKTNTVLRYLTGLTILLCIAALVVSTGTTFARYRTERSANITFEVQSFLQANIGVWEEVSREEATAERRAGTKIFQPTQFLQWEAVDGGARLHLTIANGVSETDFAHKDMKVTLRVLGTLGLWNGAEAAKLNLHYPSQEEPEKTETMQAAVSPIGEGTPLHQIHGPGWVYTFQNSEGELSWTLKGDQFSYVDLIITVEGAILTESAALQPQVFSEVIGK